MSDTPPRVTSSNPGGLTFLGALTILFIGLKLAGYITWSWLWVLSPLWLPLALFLAVIIPLGFTLAVRLELERKRSRKQLQDVRRRQRFIYKGEPNENN